MKKKFAVVCSALLISMSGVLGCGAVEDQVRDRANDEVNKQKQKAEDRVKKEVTKAMEGQ
ncbi:hypothetical protein BH24ACT20_BH24ACT20_01980 [soil metagenome]|jgi:hypothetical protein